MAQPPKLLSSFSTREQQRKILRQLRLLSDDISELSDYIAIPLSLAKRVEHKKLAAALNKDASFWDSILSAVSTSAFVVLGRILDNRAGAYLNSIEKFLRGNKSFSDLEKQLANIKSQHKELIRRVIRMRNNVFAHSSLEKPEHIAFGFQGLTWDQMKAYWYDMANLTAEIENRIFGPGQWGPKLDVRELDINVDLAGAAADRLSSCC